VAGQLGAYELLLTGLDHSKAGPAADGLLEPQRQLADQHEQLVQHHPHRRQHQNHPRNYGQGHAAGLRESSQQPQLAQLEAVLARIDAVHPEGGHRIEQLERKDLQVVQHQQQTVEQTTEAVRDHQPEQ